MCLLLRGRERESERETALVRYNLLAFVMTRNSLFGMGVVVESPVIVRAGAVRTYVFVHTHIQGTNIISNQFLFIYSSDPITSNINESYHVIFPRKYKKHSQIVCCIDEGTFFTFILDI